MPYKDPIKRAEYNKAYRIKNREAANKRTREWKKANPEKVREMHKKYAEKHKEEADLLSALRYWKIKCELVEKYYFKASGDKSYFHKGLYDSIITVFPSQFILKNLSREKDGSYNWKMNLPVIVKHYREILGHKETDEQYEGPTLFVKGEQSSYILTEEFPDYLHNFPNAKLSVVPNAGHWVHAENPEEFSRQVFDFLRN
jgi:pimeloyl-ACP methyl ester carboxylesterase